MGTPIVLTPSKLAALPHADFAKAHVSWRMPTLPKEAFQRHSQSSVTATSNDEEAAGTFINGGHYTGIYAEQTAYVPSNFPIAYTDGAAAGSVQLLYAPVALPPGGSCLTAGTVAFNAGSGTATYFAVFDACNNGVGRIAQPIDAAFISNYVSTNTHGLPVYHVQISTTDAIPSATSNWTVLLQKNDTSWTVIDQKVGQSSAPYGYSVYASLNQHGACPPGLPTVSADNIQIFDPTTSSFMAATPAATGSTTTAYAPGAILSNSCFTADASGPATDIFSMVTPNNYWKVTSAPIAHNTWTTKAAMTTARYGLGGGVIGGVLYAVGGSDNSGPLTTVEAYDPTTNSWTAKAAMSTPRLAPAVGVINGQMYVVGGIGSGFLNTVEAYNPTTNTWAPKASMTTARYFAAAGVINGILYVVGGYNGSGNLNTVEAYDPVANTWTTKTPMATSRYAPAVGVINGRMYVAGGSNNSGLLNTVEAYDPVANSWTTKTPMAVGRYGSAVGVINGQMYVAGGYNNSYLSSVEAYDPVANSWTTKTQMPTARAYAAAGAIDGTLYVVGGCCGVLNNLEAYTP